MKMAKKTKLDIALDYLRKVAEVKYLGIDDSEIVKRLRTLAKQGLEKVAAAEESTAAEQ